MGMGPAGVFIVESAGVEELAHQYAEGPIVAEMLKLLRMPYVSRRVESRAELERDARIYVQRPFDVLLFSAHGAPGEIALTTGETIPVADLLQLFQGRSSTAVLFSSCEVLAGDPVPKALSREGSPDFVLGYDTSVYWTSAALASVMLMHGLAQNEFGRLLSTLIAIRDCTGVSICGYIRTTQNDTHQWFSTDEFIKHAQETMGAKTPIELSALIATYMQQEREQFQQRTNEYFQQAKEMEEANRAGGARYPLAQAAIDKLHRPSLP